ncbi:MAG: type I restriction enzyme HsdR N-terminal domain-containing protein [Planctomycetota bacterium]|jgi:predicted type IV restriction endonuclease
MAFIPKSVIDRAIQEVGKFQKVLEAAKDRAIPKAGTVTLVSDILAEVFGYDKYAEITNEYASKGTNTDLAIKTEKAIDFLVVVRAIGSDLKEGQIKQAVEFAVKQDVPWVVLTNGLTWEIHRIRFEKPVGSDPICAFSFPDLAPRKGADQEKIFLLCREGLKNAAIEEYHYVQVVNRFKIAAVIETGAILEKIRDELKVLSGGILADPKELGELIAKEVLREDLVDGDAAKEAQAWVRKATKKRGKK